MTDNVGADGVGKATEKISEGLTDIGKKLGEAFKKAIDPDAIMSVIVDVDDKTTEVIKKFGQGRDQIDNLKISMSDAVVEVTKLGGGFGDILEIQKSVSETLGRNLVISTEAYKDLYAAQEVMGPAADSLVKDLKDVGISLYQSTGEIQKIMDRAREIGVSAQKVGEQVSQNLGMMNKYTFPGGVDGLAKMAAQAVNMRINIRDIGQTIDKAFNPESAIEMAASLQRLGVAQSDLLDPLRLMDLAQNDPAELQNQIVEMSKQFVQLNEKGQFEIMPGAKRQMKEIADAMGMSQETLSNMALSSAELGDKMSKIRFSGNFTEEEKTMIANMSEMSAGGEYKMSIDGKSLNMEEAMQTIGSMGEEERKSFFESQKPKDIAELAKDQLSVSKSMDASLKTIADKTAYAFAGAKSTSKVLKGAKEGSQKLAKVFDDKSAGTTTTQIREQIDITTKGLFDSFAGGKVNFEELTTTMKSFGSWVDGAFTKTWQNLEGELSGIFNFSTDKTKITTTDDKKTEPQSTHVIEKDGNDVIKMPGQNVNLLPQDSIFAMTKGPEFLEKLNMLNQPMNSQTNGTVNENKNTHDITLTIKIDSGNMSETKVMEILNKTETLQALNKKLKETVTNNGLIV
jgi:hypothetical protein